MRTRADAMSAEQLRKIITAAVAGIPALTKQEADTVLKAPGTLAQGIAAAFEPFKKTRKTKVVLKNPGKTISVVVPYAGDQTIAKLVKLGGYDWQNSDITDQHFPQNRQGTERVAVHLEHFARVITSEEVIQRLASKNLRAVNAAELLALGATSPSLQRHYPIIALGQEWHFCKRDSFVLCLAWHGILRRIYLLSRFKREWPAHCRFPAIPDK